MRSQSPPKFRGPAARSLTSTVDRRFRFVNGPYDGFTKTLPGRTLAPRIFYGYPAPCGPLAVSLSPERHDSEELVGLYTECGESEFRWHSEAPSASTEMLWPLGWPAAPTIVAARAD